MSAREKMTGEVLALADARLPTKANVKRQISNPDHVPSRLHDARRTDRTLSHLLHVCFRFLA